MSPDIVPQFENEHEGSVFNLESKTAMANILEEEAQNLFDESGADWLEDDITNFRLVLREMFLNMAIHGNRGLKREEGEDLGAYNERIRKNEEEVPCEKKVTVRLSITGNRALAEVQDGVGKFIPDEETAPDPTEEANILKESGRGIFLCRSLMDECKFTGGKAVFWKNRQTPV